MGQFQKMYCLIKKQEGVNHVFLFYSYLIECGNLRATYNDSNKTSFDDQTHNVSLWFQCD